MTRSAEMSDESDAMAEWEICRELEGAFCIHQFAWVQSIVGNERYVCLICGRGPGPQTPPIRLIVKP